LTHSSLSVELNIVFSQDLAHKTKIEKSALEQKLGKMQQEIQAVRSICQAQEKELDRYKQHISVQEFMKDVENVRTMLLASPLHESCVQ
jgi:hypothetical protein